jgi:hypothetical protein
MNDTATPKTTLPNIPKNLDVMVETYVRLRDTIKEANKMHEEKLAPAQEYLDQLNAAILQKLISLGVESARTKFGTAYKNTTKSATIADGALFREYVIGESQFDLVDWRANANAVSTHIDNHEGEVPPGVNYSTFTKVGIRRA